MQQATHITLREAIRDSGEASIHPSTAPGGAAPEPPRRGIFRALSTAAALAFVTLAGLVMTTGGTGCSSGEFCEGGFVRRAPMGDDPGECEGKCTAEACGADNACIDNRCVLTCASHLDCGSLAQDCAPAKEDDTNKDLLTCQGNAKGSIGIKCPFGDECGGYFACLDRSKPCDPNCQGDQCPCPSYDCKPSGTNTFHCADGAKKCDPKSPGDATTCPAADCVALSPGAYACPDGKLCDPKCTGSSCPCPQDKCNALFCRTAGVGDAEALCTLQDCHADSECPGGYWCATVRAPEHVCGKTKPDDIFCGASSSSCVDPAMNEATGATYAEGTFCALRGECRLRRQCAPCETDLDCSVVPGQHCTTMPKDGTKACTRDCATDVDCEVGFACTGGACIPRYGSCVGTGKHCEPCRTDLDCGGPGSGVACFSFGGSERACIDLEATCTNDDDCPTGPDGRHAFCANSAAGFEPGDPRLNRCFYPPLNEGSGRFSCWCSHIGTACMVKTDCCTGKCVGAIPSQQIPGECKP